MTAVNKPPVALNSWSTARRASISDDELKGLRVEVAQALAEAESALDVAVHRSYEAEQRQLVIHEHNEECERLPAWRRPIGWNSHRSGATAYRGYTKTGPDGFRHPHGEGQSSHPNVTYRCAHFEQGSVRGLVVEGWADGSKLSGFLDDVTGIADLNRNDAETGCTYVGHWTNVGGWMSLQLGAIEYPDGSIYKGYCGRVEEIQRVWPDGYGRWEFEKHAIAIRCRFERGSAQGVAVIEAQGRSVGGRFDRGRLVEVAA